ncbi:MAG: hypothetical protein JXR78_03230, partial [Victivallales bacterium]|nr:hypothetical protein [Victivallales bacterium]
SMLLPALSKARDRGYQVKCASNLSQLGKGMAMYIGDNNDILPYFNINNTQEGGWQLAVFQYVKNYSLYKCDKDFVKRNAGSYKPCSYAFNTKSYSDPVDRPSGKMIGKIKVPSEVFALVESPGTMSWVDAGWVSGTTKCWWTYSNSASKIVHRNGGNFLFVDGHVAFYPYAEIRMTSPSGPLKGYWTTTTGD